MPGAQQSQPDSAVDEDVLPQDGTVVAAGSEGVAGRRDWLRVIQSNFPSNSPHSPGATCANRNGSGGGRSTVVVGAIATCCPPILLHKCFLPGTVASTRPCLATPQHPWSWGPSHMYHPRGR